MTLAHLHSTRLHWERLPVFGVASQQPRTMPSMDQDAQARVADGLLHCGAGWTGAACQQEQKRHCVASHHMAGFTPNGPPESLSTPGWTASRCGGTALPVAAQPPRAMLALPGVGDGAWCCRRITRCRRGVQVGFTLIKAPPATKPHVRCVPGKGRRMGVAAHAHATFTQAQEDSKLPANVCAGSPI